MQQQPKSREDTITLGVLEAVAAGDGITQRRLASDLGIALGLVNIYLKRCINKGLVKVQQIPAKRYAYYLTPHGFAEKSRLTAEYLSWSLTFFRRAREACAEVMAQAKAKRWSRIVLAGAGDLAEIARICAADAGLEIVALIDPDRAGETVGRLTVVATLADVESEFDGVVVTNVLNGAQTHAAMAEALGASSVIALSLVAVGSGNPSVTVGAEDKP